MKDCERTLVILGYHKIGPPSAGAWETWYYVSESKFLEHLSCLRDGGWEVLDLAGLLLALADPETLPRRAAIITFDDGYRCVLQSALPCLLKFGFPAIHFVPTDFIGDCNRFDEGAEPEEPICNWGELQELARQGVAVQAHGASHRTLSILSPEVMAEELCRPKEILERRLGKPVELFAFPYGDGGRNAQLTTGALKKAGYKAAFLYGGGTAASPIADPFRLPRLAIGPDTDLRSLLE
jgi:peptidoglycan/xylan/chitin deacetylase (PgdA/CDA1 family)